MRKHSGSIITAGGAALILAATLWPIPGNGQEDLSFWCILCADRDTADGLLNVLLFLPFGTGLAILHGPALAMGGSFALSGTVEFIQANLPGRHSSIGDILCNTLGGALGAVLVFYRIQIACTVMAPPRWAKIGAALLPLAAFLVMATLSAPYFPETQYHGQWTRQLGNLSPYPGRVLSASIGQLHLPDHQLPSQEAVREAFRSGEPLRIEALAGHPPARLSHLFAIYDSRQWEVVLLTVQGPNLFFQRGTLSARLLLEKPFVKWEGAMGAPQSDTIRITVRQEPRNLCLEVGQESRCDLSAGVGAGWRLIRRIPGASPALVALLSLIWLSLFSLPAGAVLGGVGRGVPVGLTVGLLGCLMSWWSPWLSLQPFDLVAPIPGAWVGWSIRRRWARVFACTERGLFRKQ